MDHMFLGWLMNCFNTTDRTLSVHGRKFTITPEDVGVLLGIRSTGVVPRVDGPTEEGSNFGVELGIADDGNLTIESVKNALKNHSSHGDDFKKAFALLAMVAMLLPARSRELGQICSI